MKMELNIQCEKSDAALRIGVPLAVLASVQQPVPDRLIEACLTGKECRTSDEGRRRWAAISLGGFGLLTKHCLWRHAADCIARLDTVHPRAQERFLDTWVRVGWLFRGYVGDDDLFFALLRKMLPAYHGADRTLYRGQLNGYPLGPSWSRSHYVALKFALFGDLNIDPYRLALNGTRKNGRANAVVLTADVSANHIICAPCLMGRPEGEYIVDPRFVTEFKSEDARSAAIWIREDLGRRIYVT